MSEQKQRRSTANRKYHVSGDKPVRKKRWSLLLFLVILAGLVYYLSTIIENVTVIR